MRIAYHLCTEEWSGVRNHGPGVSPTPSNPQRPHHSDEQAGFGHLWTPPTCDSVRRQNPKTNLQCWGVRETDLEVEELPT